MLELPRRPNARARVIRLHEDDGRFDRDFWPGVSSAERVALLWQMVEDWADWRGIDGVSFSEAWPRDLADLEILERYRQG